MITEGSKPAHLRRPLLLGHRGCRGAFPENTFAAFEHALASGCDGFEFDVRLTADNVPVIWHDSGIRRKPISTYNYKDILRRCMSPSRWSLAGKRSIELCTLEQVLERYGKSAFLNVELKVSGAEALAAELCRRYGAERVVVSSFLPEVVKRFHSVAGEIPVGFIFDTREGLKSWRELPGTHVMPKQRFVTSELIAEMHSRGRKVIAWTVNDEKRMRQLAEWGVDGLISDDPERLSHCFGGRAA